MNQSDTIAAIATGMSHSGIGIVRISGDRAFAVIDKIFKSKGKDKKISEQKSHTAHYGYIMANDQKIDEALVLIMRGPHSYTAEDTIEIQSHGGVFVMQSIMETVLSNGARAAEPGEFTRRAFLNGRIDLSQAEAVMDVIHSKNQYALNASVEQLSGRLSGAVREMRDKIIYQIAFIESALDDPEHISLDGYPDQLKVIVSGLIDELERLTASFDSGRLFKEGIRTVILGKPNAGKSSLMNLLLGQERAIVTDIAGTTRDVLEEQIRIGGISLNIFDTAGIRETDDVVEKIGVDKAIRFADEADLLIFVADSSVKLDENDESIISMIRTKHAVVLLNKSDLTPAVTAEHLKDISGKKVISFSAKEGTGLDLLEQEIKAMFFNGDLTFNDQIHITNIRQKQALSEACESLRLVAGSISARMPEDFYSIDLMNAYEKLGLVIGEAVDDDLVNQIFSKFCMGK